MIYKVTFHISTIYIYQISSTQELSALQDMKRKKERKKEENLLHDFILYTQQTSYMKWKANIA